MKEDEDYFGFRGGMGWSGLLLSYWSRVGKTFLDFPE
jgi:hypothetical protein